MTETGGGITQLPSAAASGNLLQRSARFRLSGDGTLSGSVEETRSGSVAYLERREMTDLQDYQRGQVIEQRLRRFLGSFQLQSSELVNLDEIGENVIARYQLQAPRFAQVSGDLLLLRPRVIGQKSSDFLEDLGDRKCPVQYDASRTDTDLVEIELPSRYRPDQLPDPIHVATDFADYASSISLKDNVLRYERVFTIKQTRFLLPQVPECETFCGKCRRMRAPGPFSREARAIKALRLPGR